MDYIQAALSDKNAHKFDYSSAPTYCIYCLDSYLQKFQNSATALVLRTSVYMFPFPWNIEFRRITKDSS